MKTGKLRWILGGVLLLVLLLLLPMTATPAALPAVPRVLMRLTHALLLGGALWTMGVLRLPEAPMELLPGALLSLVGCPVFYYLSRQIAKIGD